MNTGRPVDPISSSIEGHLRQPRQYPAHLMIRSVGRIQLLETAMIEWLAGAGNYVEICIGGESMLHREPLHALEHRLDPEQFVRIHRSVIVRRASVREIRTVNHGDYIVACERRSFRIGRTYRAALGLLGDVRAAAQPSAEPALTAQPRGGRAW